MRIIIVPHFHYDVAYLRTFEEYLPLCFENLREAARLMDAEPEYRFLIEQPILLEELRRRCPEDFARLRACAGRGQVEVACGMWSMPDMNFPSGESLVRQALVGKTWVREHLGLDVPTCWIADCWGHPATLPQLLAHCGYRYYAFSRGMVPELQQTDFRWRSPDGTEIQAHWMAIGYGPLLFPDLKHLENALEQDVTYAGEDRLMDLVERIRPWLTTENVLLGNGGDFVRPQAGGPELVRRWRAKGHEVRFGTTPEYFAALEGAGLPLYEGEFNPLLSGTYASRIAINQANRRLEYLLLALERAGAAAWLAGRPAAAGDIGALWKTCLKNQFHDISSGTLVDAANADVMAEYGAAEAEAERLLGLQISDCRLQIADCRPGGSGAHHCPVVNGAASVSPAEVENPPVARSGDRPHRALPTDAAGPQTERRVARSGDRPHRALPTDAAGFQTEPPVAAASTAQAGHARPDAGERGSVALFNPSGFGRQEVVSLPWAGAGVAGPDGPLVCQPDARTGGTLVGVRLRALEASVLRSGWEAGEPAGGEPNADSSLPASAPGTSHTESGQAADAGRPADAPAAGPVVLDNGLIRVTVGTDGTITSVVDAATGREFVDPERPYWGDLVYRNDNGDLWLLDRGPLDGGSQASRMVESDVRDPYARSDDPLVNAGPICQHAGQREVTLLENGPLRWTVRVNGALGFWRNRVEFETHISLCRGSRRIAFETRIVPAGRHYRLHACFPTALREGRIRHEVAFGVQERDQRLFAAQNWIDLGTESHGVCLLNRGIPGNMACDGVLSLLLFRSAAMEYKGESAGAFCEGVPHTFHYAVLPWEESETPAFHQEGEAFNLPVALAPCSGPSGRNVPGLEIAPAAIHLAALYRSGERLVLRVYEAAGAAAEGCIRLPAGVTECLEADGLENPGAPVPVEAGRIRVPFRPHQIRTFLLRK